MASNAGAAMDLAGQEAQRLFMEETEQITQGGGRLNAMCVDPNLRIEDMGPMRCFDDLSSGSEEECDGEGDLEDADEMPSTSQIRSGGWGKKPKKTSMPRAIVDELHIVTLVKAYRVEFAAFCRGKKRAPKQIIPGKVWEKVYHGHYLVTFPSSVFGEDTLKKHLRDQLAELDIGIANNGLRPNLQDEVIATEVRGSDCSTTRNILRMRQSFVGSLPSHGVSPAPLPRASLSRPAAPSGSASPKTYAPTTSAQPPSRPTTPASTSCATTGANSHRPTKSDMLQKQAEAVCTIATDFHSIVEKHALSMDDKQARAEEQTLLMATKRARHQLTLLKEGLEIEVITDEDYKARVVELLKL